MKVVRPTPLLSEAADMLAGVEGEVVVVGAAALEVALAEGAGGATSATRDLDLVVITPTRDVEAVVTADRAARVVAHLEAARAFDGERIRMRRCGQL